MGTTGTMGTTDGISILGVAGALTLYAISVSPSLLPKRWWWHAFESGALAALGYCLGWLLDRAGGYLLAVLQIQIQASYWVKDSVPAILLVFFLLWFMHSIVTSFRSSKQAALSINMRPERLGEYLIGVLGTLAMFGFTMQVVRLCLWIGDLVYAILRQWVIGPVASVLTTVILTASILLISNRIVFRAFLSLFARKAVQLNNLTAINATAPTVPERSGSPQSSTSWQSIGGQGRLYLMRGPNAADIEMVTHRPAKEPIRLYIGLSSKDARRSSKDPELFRDAIHQAIQEMHRTGAFQRKLIIVNTVTGSGWVDEWLCQPAEYLTGGDVATVSLQYSYLFSAVLLFTGLEHCERAGKDLFHAIKTEVDKLPPGHRPLLVVTGESLGAIGSQAAFPDLADFLSQADGAIWVGSPQGASLSTQLTAARHKGSAQIAPVYDSGRNARFITHPSQLETDIYERELGQWEYPRAVFVQHASDPVVWYTPKIAFHEPDWLREKAGTDVSPNMSFTPIATFMQVLCDLPIAGTAPEGHGHTYHRELIPVWRKILGEDDRPSKHSADTPVTFALDQWLTHEMELAIAMAIQIDVEETGGH